MSERNRLHCAASACDGCTVCEPEKWLRYFQEENEKLRKCLKLVIAMAGSPDPAEGCRKIIEQARKALEGE